VIPSDYRLENVSARLLERLEGTRRSYAGRAPEAREQFERICREHVDAALAEFKGLNIEDQPELHGEFLMREVLETFLPRYFRLATAQTQAENSGAGFGPLATPVGRIGLAGAGIAAAFFFARVALFFPLAWPVVLFALSVPFWPAIAMRATRNSYNSELQSLLQDLAQIQEQAGAYARPDKLKHQDPLDEALAAAKARARAQKDKSSG